MREHGQGVDHDKGGRDNSALSAGILMSGTETALIQTTICRWLVALRVHHWTKSGFCLAALLFHGAVFDGSAWFAVLPAAVCFCLVSSAVYLANDIFNRKEDRCHPNKRDRPIAAGHIAVRAAWVVVTVLVATALGLSFVFYGGGSVTWVLIAYYLLSWLYSFCLRGLPLVDVLVIGLGFVARVAAGAFALQSFDFTAHPTGWLVGCTYFLALLLGFGKRKGEWLLMESSEVALGSTRRALRGYTAELLNVLIGCSALFAGAIYVAYCLSRSDRMPFVLTAVPALLGLLSYLKLAWGSTSVETPEYLLLRSRSLLISLGGWLVLVGWFTAIR